MLDLKHASRDELIRVVLAQRDALVALERQGARQQESIARLEAALAEVTRQLGAAVSAGGRLTRTVAPYRLRYIHRYELELLLERAGFALAELLGDHALSPFAADSLHLIAVARPAPKRALRVTPAPHGSGGSTVSSAPDQFLDQADE